MMRPLLRPLILALPLVALAACQEESAALPQPVTLTAEAVGHYCQMNMLEHPGPMAQVFLDGIPYPLFFSQVRDAVAYQRMPEQSHMIRTIYVSDMGAPQATWEEPGADNWTPAETAHYVTGSDMVGGMEAPELVPFATREAAEAFAARHGGEVRALADVPDALVLAPVEFEHDHGAGDDANDDADFDERLRALSDGRG
jgi:copper chaperone NosL